MKIKNREIEENVMIYLLSDPHGGDYIEALYKYIDTAGKDDLLIILGDVGVKFTETEENIEFDRRFLASDKKIAFLDGNHENFPYIYSHPEEEWCGGAVHRLTDNIVHLKRGNIYTIEGKTFFTFGGCKSSPVWKEKGLWYKEESPTDEELELAYKNLKSVKRVDYILTHKYDRNEDDKTEGLFELCKFIDSEVDFGFWYAGHWHAERAIDEKHALVFDGLVGL